MSSLPARTLRTIAAHLRSFAPALLLAACAGSPVQAPVGTPPAGEQTVAKQAAAVAMRQVGVPYRYGGSSPEGFDCSGLVHYAYARAGKAVPRTTADQWRQLRPVAGNELEVGDVLFFDIEGKASHVGLYLGRQRFVHAPESGREVTIGDLDSGFYRQAFIRAGRP
jgi:cell wall-associated NlpC family hydrolase